jgi:hypothetical protein
MKFLFVAATALATASAFTTSPAAFTTSVPQVGGSVNNIFSEGNAHRTRRSTIVMDGKANGEYILLLLTIGLRSPSIIIPSHYFFNAINCTHLMVDLIFALSLQPSVTVSIRSKTPKRSLRP